MTGRRTPGVGPGDLVLHCSQRGDRGNCGGQLGDILEEIVTLLARFVHLPSWELFDVLALWAVGTHVHFLFSKFGYLLVTAPTTAAGKSRLLEVLSLLVRRAEWAHSITPAGLFRVMDALHPTLLLDEADQTELRGRLQAVLNSGYARNGRVRLATGTFSTFGPKVICGIDHPLPGAVRSRCIAIPMRRRTASDRAVEDFAEDDLRAGGSAPGSWNGLPPSWTAASVSSNTTGPSGLRH